MLRVEIQDFANNLSLKLEGRFAGDDAENTRMLTTRCRDRKTLVVDLTEVTFVDSVGEEVLLFYGRFGAEFVAETSYSLDVCERLHLRLVRSGVSDANTSDASRTSSRRRRTPARQPENEKV